MNDPAPAIHAATETARLQGVTPDRCDILQNGDTVVLRLTDTLVARAARLGEGPRGRMDWFARETAAALHLTRQGAPIAPLHDALPPGPHAHAGFVLNFWEYITRADHDPDPAACGRTLRECHEHLRSFPEPLPNLGVLRESLALLETAAEKEMFPPAVIRLLRDRLSSSMEALGAFPFQPLHGDAHTGNIMNTASSPLWTDWEDIFLGPVEWDLASLVWNARLLDGDHAWVARVLEAYGPHDPAALRHSLIARAAVMSIWYPFLYPSPSPERAAKLRRRLQWLENPPT